MKKSFVADPALAPLGRVKIEWVRKNMPILSGIEAEFGKNLPFRGLRIAVSIHLEAKTAFLAEVFAAGGAEVAVTGSNPLSTKDDVAAALAETGIRVYATHSATREEYEGFLDDTISIGPHVIVDDGGDLVHHIHENRPELVEACLGACEETTAGLLRARARARDGKLLFPVMASNDAMCKHLFDNRYGSGQSIWDGVIRTTNLLVTGKTAVIAGYGWTGKGCAMRASGLGARVIVTEVDPVKALEAVMDGFTVLPMREAAPLGDFFLTLTGCRDVIRGEHAALMKDGAVLANGGHFFEEINIAELEALAVERREVRENITGFRMKDGRWINLLGMGRLVNIVCADGHPADIMDMSFAVQALAAEYLVRNRRSLPPEVITVPAEIDRRIALRKLAEVGAGIDILSAEQERYLNSWKL